MFLAKIIRSIYRISILAVLIMSFLPIVIMELFCVSKFFSRLRVFAAPDANTIKSRP